MKLLEAFKKQISQMGKLKHVWLTTFNLDIAFVETWVLPAVLGIDPPVSRMDYEALQRAMNESGIDFRIYCDPRMMAKDKPKRTSVAVYPVSVRELAKGEAPLAKYLNENSSLFHPKVFYLEDEDKKIVVGAGSANLTLSGWGRNQEAVDFRCIANNQQYQQVKQFFIYTDSALAHDDFFPVRRKFVGKDDDWSFIHSLGGETLFEALANGQSLRVLSVWSPYLAEDLSGFIDEFEEPDLRFELVPDLVHGRYIRTRWDAQLQALIADNRLALFHSPVARDNRTLMTHAKLWLAESSAGKRLAIGSWNFTLQGCCSLEKTGWNVEAGIVHKVPRNTQICTDEWAVDADDFASEELLEEEKLEPGDLPPFDLTVMFNWARCEYEITGKWFGSRKNEVYQLLLPGINGPVELVWKARGNELKLPQKLVVLKSDAVLNSPFYSLRTEGKTDWQGMIVETGTEYRRALSFASLDDLLNSYLSSADPAASERLMLRAAGAQDEMQGEGEEEIVSSDAISYFRLFQATQQRRNWLAQTENGAQLYRCLFTEPGCLQELAEMARERVELAKNTVFDWFLAQEVNSLAALAKKRVGSIRRHCGADAITVAPHLWESLQVTPPRLEGDAESLSYITAITKDCGYVE
nr:phospholipase D family protein [Cedecea lapagei]